MDAQPSKPARRNRAQIAKDERAVMQIAAAAEVTKRFDVESVRNFYDTACELLVQAGRL